MYCMNNFAGLKFCDRESYDFVGLYFHGTLLTLQNLVIFIDEKTHKFMNI